MVGLVALMPVACNYIMEGGLWAEWIVQSERYDLTFCWQIYQLVLQVGTLLCSALLFGRVLDSGWDSFAVLAGSALYELCPYRICLCYDWANLPLAAAFMLLPLCLWGLLGLTAPSGKKVLNLFVTCMSGILLAAVLAFCFARGLLGGDSPYVLGAFFTSYAYDQTHPGMGIALLLSLFVGGWLVFVKGNGDCDSGNRHFDFIRLSRFSRWFALGGCLCLLLSLCSLHGTSMLFFGLAQLFLCIPASCALQECRSQPHKFLSVVIPVMVLAACVGLAVYQCNTLTYTRYPLTGK